MAPPEELVAILMQLLQGAAPDSPGAAAARV
jgi:hypothetical protein